MCSNMWPRARPRSEFDYDWERQHSTSMQGKRKRSSALWPMSSNCSAEVPDTCGGAELPHIEGLPRHLEDVTDGSAVLASWQAAAQRHYARMSTVTPAQGPDDSEPRCDEERETGPVGAVLSSWHLAAQRYATHLGSPAKGPDEFEISSCDMNMELNMGPSGNGLAGLLDAHEGADRGAKMQHTLVGGAEPEDEGAPEGGKHPALQMMGVSKGGEILNQGSHPASHQVSHAPTLWHVTCHRHCSCVGIGITLAYLGRGIGINPALPRATSPTPGVCFEEDE